MLSLWTRRLHFISVTKTHTSSSSSSVSAHILVTMSQCHKSTHRIKSTYKRHSTTWWPSRFHPTVTADCRRQFQRFHYEYLCTIITAWYSRAVQGGWNVVADCTCILVACSYPPHTHVYTHTHTHIDLCHHHHYHHCSRALHPTSGSVGGQQPPSTQQRDSSQPM